MTSLGTLLAWANAPFVVALGVAVVFFVLQASGLLGLLAGAGDHGGDSDHEAGHAGADADAASDAGADADHAHAHGGAAAGNGGSAAHGHGGSAEGLLAGMGVGRMPLSIVWQSFAVCFALGGIAANAVYLSYAGALPAAALAISLPAALVFAYVATRLIAGLFRRLVPAAGKTSTSRGDLVGKVGVVISSKVGPEFGEVRVTDATGIVHRVICRVPPGDEPIPEGREVVLVEHDRDRDLLFVAPLDPDLPRSGGKVRVAAAPEQSALEEEALSEAAAEDDRKRQRAP